MTPRTEKLFHSGIEYVHSVFIAICVCITVLVLISEGGSVGGYVCLIIVSLAGLKRLYDTRAWFTTRFTRIVMYVSAGVLNTCFCTALALGVELQGGFSEFFVYLMTGLGFVAGVAGFTMSILACMGFFEEPTI